MEAPPAASIWRSAAFSVRADKPSRASTGTCTSVTPLQRRKRGATHDGFRGAPRAVIALWLGHESVETTQTYLHAHLALKEAALAKLARSFGALEARRG